MYKYITYNSEIYGGKPIIAGTRLSVEFIMELVASGASFNDIKNSYPQLSIDAIQEAIRYSADAVKNEILITSKIQ